MIFSNFKETPQLQNNSPQETTSLPINYSVTNFNQPENTHGTVAHN